jgi:ATP-dependent Clp protease ATP-binding subunit ClpX
MGKIYVPKNLFDIPPDDEVDDSYEVSPLLYDLQAYTPQKIKEMLDPYVIGQDHIKEALSIIGYNALVRFNNEVLGQEVFLKKTNLIMLGPSGSGKTYLIEVLGKVLTLPVASCDVTTLTQTGWVGKDVTSIFSNLKKVAEDLVFADAREYPEKYANVDITKVIDTKVKYGIVYLDEIDKLKSYVRDSGTRDISGTGVQEELLKMIEGVTTTLDTDNKKSQYYGSEVDTSNITFIGGGAFSGLDEIIMDRCTPNSLGFHHAPRTEEEKKVGKLKKVEQRDLIRYGLMREFVGRFQKFIVLDKLTDDFLAQILTESKNGILASYINQFKLLNVNLVLSREATLAIAKYAATLDLGARSLHTILAGLLHKYEYELPSTAEVDEIIISGEEVEDFVKRMAL